MNALNDPLRTGWALAATVGLAYAACTLVFWLFPGASASFMASLFHGIDLTRLQTGMAPFRFEGFAYALVVIMAWAFAVGTLFGWLYGTTKHTPS